MRPQTKMKQGMSYSKKEKTIILNVFKYFRIEYPEKCVTELVRKTSKATGCSEKSIFQFRKEEESVEGFKEPSRTKIRKHLNINSRDIKYDASVREAIRVIIYDLKYKNVIPSLNTILKQVNSSSSLPNFSLMTLRRLLFDMGFYYEKNGNKSILVERGENEKKLSDDNKKLEEKRLQVDDNPIPFHYEGQPSFHPPTNELNRPTYSTYNVSMMINNNYEMPNAWVQHQIGVSN
ncbi:PREDICTED: uncharacterized protein LOC108556407 [Nicrophorus vespilloides]|uniref:Uncharacterized protein LOC108556407 n=1 Tax=Nicrophorus vespilloides TaxID=110193 RepID=A0ABM1M0B1_NICVS|nr:PREDICTED: uncharacterized protein LOC108556407 [Nicrophorus vespilloides]